jgi:hypothetical protein
MSEWPFYSWNADVNDQFEEVAAFAVVVGLMLAPLLLLVRAVYYLVTGEWVWSLCDIIFLFRKLKPGECAVATGFPGLDHISNYLIAGIDASLSLLCIALLVILTLISLAFLGWLGRVVLRKE